MENNPVNKIRKHKRKNKRRRYYKGKRISKGELKIAKFLDEYEISFIREYTYKNCRSHKNALLRFDFYLADQNILIEYQGQHHYGPVNKYRRAKIVYEKTKCHDEIKKNFVAKNNIYLLEIHYKDYKKIEEILKYILHL